MVSDKDKLTLKLFFFFFLFESRRKSSQEPFYKLLENAHYFWKVLFQLKRLVKPHLILADSVRLSSDFK